MKKLAFKKAKNVECPVKYNELLVLYNELKDTEDKTTELYKEKKNLYLTMLAEYNKFYDSDKKTKSEQKTAYIKASGDIIKGLISIGAVVWGVKKSLEFEKNDTITSTAGKSLFSTLLKGGKL